MADTQTEAATRGKWDDVEFALTTVDNPFDPFTEFNAWFAFDTAHGYHSAGLLARVARSSDDLSDADQHFAIQEAIDEIVSENVSGMHRKVSRSQAKGEQQTNEQQTT